MIYHPLPPPYGPRSPPPPLPPPQLPPSPPEKPLSPTTETFEALYLPFLSSQSLSQVTWSPAARPPRPVSRRSFTWMKRSSLPSSGEMKPKPLSSKNFFTLPVTAMLERHCGGSARTPKGTKEQGPQSE